MIRADLHAGAWRLTPLGELATGAKTERLPHVASAACADCKAGSGTCDGGSWDADADTPGVCPCAYAGHPCAVVMTRDRRTPDEVMADLAAERYERGLDRPWGDA